jgi:hypothetical protein
LPQSVPVHLQPPLVAGPSVSPIHAESLVKIYRQADENSPGLNSGAHQQSNYGQPQQSFEQTYREQQYVTQNIGNLPQPIGIMPTYHTVPQSAGVSPYYGSLPHSAGAGQTYSNQLQSTGVIQNYGSLPQSANNSQSGVPQQLPANVLPGSSGYLTGLKPNADAQPLTTDQGLSLRRDISYDYPSGFTNAGGYAEIQPSAGSRQPGGSRAAQQQEPGFPGQQRGGKVDETFLPAVNRSQQAAAPGAGGDTDLDDLMKSIAEFDVSLRESSYLL